jgi:hypothetical protein
VAINAGGASEGAEETFTIVARPSARTPPRAARTPARPTQSSRIQAAPFVSDRIRGARLLGRMRRLRVGTRTALATERADRDDRACVTIRSRDR